MKKLLAASCLSLAFMAGAASAANILSIVTDNTATLDANYNPVPGTGGIGAGTFLGNDVSGAGGVATAAGSGLVLNANADIKFTYIGKEAGNTNILLDGAQIFSTMGAAGGDFFTMANVAGSGGFLPFTFKSDGTLVATNGGAYTNASIAFKVLTDTLTYVKVLVLLNDPGADTDYDDMVIQIEASTPKSDVTETPIPGGVMLLMSGLAGLGYMGRSRRTKKA